MTTPLNEEIMNRSRIGIYVAFVMSVAMIVSLCTFPAAVWAHAIVIDSFPAEGATLSQPPAHVILRFNAKIIPALAVVNLTTGSGKKIALPHVSDKSTFDASADRLVVTLPHLVKGSYVIRYKVLATDGHATLGILHFNIR